MDWLKKYNSTRQNDFRHKADDEFDLFMQLSGVDDIPVDTDVAWNKIAERIQQKTSIQTWIFRIAAMLILSFGLGWAIFQQNVADDVKYIVITAADQKENVVLPDGSNITLSQGSMIKYPENDCREVTLKGKAYFDVTENQADFVVNAGEVSITVLGTVFSVNSSEEAVSLFVEEGEVSFSNMNSEVIVYPNQEVFYSYEKQKVFRRKSPDPNIISWKTGHFIFDNTPVPQVLDHLEDYYQVQFSNGQVLDDCVISANLDNLPLESVLETLSFTLNAEFSQNESIIRIESSGCK